MGEESRRRSRISRNWNRLITAGPTSLHDLADHLLERVLLGLDSPACLVRAAAACKRWRRVVAGADDGGGAFLRRFRSLHPPQAIGTYYSINLDKPYAYGESHLWPEVDPVFVPSSASAVSGSDGQSRLFQLSLDFVPPPHSGGKRELVDGRGSLLLLLKEKERPYLGCMCCFHDFDSMVPDLIVCEPVTRQYQAIPPPDYGRFFCILSAFLLDGEDADEAGGGIGLTNFRVLLVEYEHEWDDNSNWTTGHGFPSASMFISGSNGGWYCGEKDEAGGVYLPSFDHVHLAGRTGGRIYWGCQDHFNDKYQVMVMVLDERTLQFSTMALSDDMMNGLDYGRDNFRVVGAGDGTVRLVYLTFYGTDVVVFGQRKNGCRGTGDWELEMKVQLEEVSPGLPGLIGSEEAYSGRGIKIIDADERLVTLSPDNEAWHISVDLETMEVKREQERKQYTGPAFPYTLPWPPVMRACVDCRGW